MIASTREGDTVEVATVGNEGATGVIAMLSGSKQRAQQVPLVKVRALIPGAVVRMRVDACIRSNSGARDGCWAAGIARSSKRFR